MTQKTTNPNNISRRRLLIGSAVAVPFSAMALTASKSFSGNTAYKYDDLGRLVRVTHPDGKQTAYSYDAADNRIQVATASSSSSSSSSSSGPVIIQVTASSNLRTLANNAGYTGAAGANYQFVVASGVTIMGASNGGRGIDTGTWPAGSTLTLIVNGNLYGGGGNGGNGSNSGAGFPGGAGGDAVYAQAPLTITLNSGGSIKGGGGGGGGGSYQSFSGMGGGTIGGEGSGGGFPNGAAGLGTMGSYHEAANNGSAGTTAGGGAGAPSTGGPPGGAGGNAATAGANGLPGSTSGGVGGSAGYAIRKNGKVVAVTNNGTITGTVG